MSKGMARQARSKRTDIAVGDGPYVWHTGEGYRAYTAFGDDHHTVEHHSLQLRLAIPGAADQPDFTVDIEAGTEIPSLAGSSDTHCYPDDGRDIVVIGDTHGEFAIVTTLLRHHGIVDSDLAWSFGEAHLVLLGDVFDRGAHQVALLWLFYKLDREARAAGGRFTLLIGNHEAMVLRGDLRYLHKRHARTARILGKAGYGDLFDGASVLGAWLRTCPALARIGTMLFCHGGVSPELAETWASIAELNAHVSQHLDLPLGAGEDERSRMVLDGRAGPLWYRGYFERGAKRPGRSDVAAALAQFGATRIFVGHTPVKKIGLKLGGLVVASHVYPRQLADGRIVFEALMRRDGKWQRVTASGEAHAFPLRRGAAE